ncbi:P-loop containing nucleoside triphosphate hydrolase protein [Aspergillus karnatakaensis]|uniref:gluconokinase n=1 Tax=Aspergillus karnatakaensis TaxID=1810916 RepID=UPI003CCE3922
MLSAGERQPHAVVDPSRTKVSALSHTTPTTSAPMRSEQVNVPPQNLQHIWVVTGPAGSGKSTVGRYLQQQLGVPFLEGDDYHPAANKDKMSAGIPLTDADRWDWLIALRSAATTLLSPAAAPVPSSSTTNSTTTAPSTRTHPAPPGVVVACSALKKKYRDVMRVAAYGSPNVRIHFVYLKLDPETLYNRVSARQAHYMKPEMVASQLKDLEEPVGEWDALTVDVKGSMADVQGEVIRAVDGVLAGYAAAGR